MEPYYFYGGYCSQWYPTNFVFKGVTYTSSEQWMMAMKAASMNDYSSYAKIMNSSDPKYIKELGRNVKNYDDKKWSEERYKVVVFGNYLKFNQNEKLKDWLINTKDKMIVEASPIDKIWGIGLSVKDANAGKEWKGDNLLGKAIMEVRDKLNKKFV
jgi:ribA/ribD-fused uncharacterized protein